MSEAGKEKTEKAKADKGAKAEKKASKKGVDSLPGRRSPWAKPRTIRITFRGSRSAISTKFVPKI